MKNTPTPSPLSSGSPFKRLAWLPCALLPLAAQAAPASKSDNFESGDPRTSLTANSIQWYGSSSGNVYIETVSSNQVLRNHFDPGGSYTTARSLIGYFTGAGNPFSVAVGERISASFDVTFTAENGDFVNGNFLFRVALLNSGNNRNTGDASANLVVNGYSVMTNPNNSGDSNLTFRERNSNSANLLNSVAETGAWGTRFGLDKVDGLTFAQGNTYSVSFSVERINGTQVRLSQTISDGTDSVSSSYAYTPNTLTTQFDTLAIAWANYGGGYIDNVVVAVSAVPEPSAAAVLGGLAALASVSLRRRRR